MSRGAGGWAGAAVLAVLASLALAACAQVDDQAILEVEGTGEVVGFVFIDLNGTGQPDPGDEGVEGWQVRLEQPGGGVVATAVTDTEGNFEFPGVPVGEVVLRMDPGLLGDTVETFGTAFEPVTLAMGDTVVLQPGVTYPTMTVGEAREAPLGKPLFVTGVALNRLFQSVSVLHVKDAHGDGSVIRVRDLVGFQANMGDSVRVRGRTAREAGQPLLELGAVFRLGLSSATLEPVELTTGVAAGAEGGTLDADLVQVRNADILEVQDLDDQGIRLVVNDGSGELEILLRAFLNADPDDLDPALMRLTRARGLLVPRDDAGQTRWTLQPRTTSDYRVDEIGAPASRR